MELSQLDWSIVFAFFGVSLIIGIWVSRKSGKSATEFFLSGRNMPWWLLGISMVATTFSADTPNLVTDIVRQNGVAGNWVWWAFLLTGMLTVFVYARLWRRSKVLTDLEFYELRYSGKEASFLRGFRAIYLGVFFNVVIMATVCLAAIKIGYVLLGLNPIQTILIASVVTVLYSALGGLRGVIFTDLVQFILAMVGSIWATWVILDLPEIGNLQTLFTHENVSGKLNLLPDFNDPKQLVPLLIIPLAVQWWSVWYPGAEPGGGGYVAQRMLSARSEKHAVGATLLFNIAHYALRPWPWIIIALASLIIFPLNIDHTAAEGSLAAEGLVSLADAFPGLGEDKLKHDLAYSAMLRFLPAGLLGLVVASLIAAFMSTISTHLNWGASYMVNDIHKRFINPKASDNEQVWIGRMSTVILMVLAGMLALFLENALEAFDILLQIGAGTGLIFILRWFWWRINVYSEITGMVVSFLVALWLSKAEMGLESHEELLLGVGITTASWLIVTFLTPPTDKQTLRSYYEKIRPWGKSWGRVLDIEVQSVGGASLPYQILGMILGCLGVYCALFSTGSFLYGNLSQGMILAGITLISAYLIFRLWPRFGMEN